MVLISGAEQDIQQQGSVVHSFRGRVQKVPPNLSTLPRLTVAFEVVVGQTASSNSSTGTLVLRSPASARELRRHSIYVLLERELPLTPETLSLALSFTHSTMLCTPIISGSLDQHSVPTHPASGIEHITTRIVRVLPPVSFRPRITNGCLPTELLIKTFQDNEFWNNWHKDLLSFAQVCRAWSCAMDVLHARLGFSDDGKLCQSRHLLDVYALAKALSDKPILGYGFHRFTTNNVGITEDWKDVFSTPPRSSTARFTEALIAILRTTKNVRHLHLSQLDACQADALFVVLHELRDLHTVSIGEVEEKLINIGGLLRHPRMDGEKRLLSAAQLARCLSRWPALKSLKLRHLHGFLGLWRFALRPPMCALTQLTLSRSRVGDKDLVHLFASSAKTLETVVLDRIEGVTNAGLVAFLLAISQNVACLTVQDVALPPFQQWGNLVIGRTERALDVVVGKMPRLRELRISGDVASEFMLDRRTKMFIARETSEGTRVPVVQLWLDDVPRLCGFTADGKWPGWCTPGKVPRR